MHNKKIKKFLRKTKPNSGFTLTELLTGLIMSVFVTGALGFGLYQIMQATAKEKAKTNTRNEASRAIEFISDELRRAQTIETDETNATNFDPTGKVVVLALNIPELNNSSTLDSDDNAATPERVVYYLKEADNGGVWQGPLVLYRWGPPFDASGNYTTGNWGDEALIDGIDDTVVANASGICDTGDALSPATPKGFYACVNGTNTAAQIFITGGIDTDNIEGNDSNYTAQTRAVARAKEVSVSNAQAAAVQPITFRSLEADYTCNAAEDEDGNPIDIEGYPIDPVTRQRIPLDAQGYPVDGNGQRIPGEKKAPRKPKTWTMRMDFDNSNYDSSANRPDRDQATKWVHEPGRQPQPIDIDSNADLIIHSIPIEATGCLNAEQGNEGASSNEPLSNFVSENGLDNESDKYTVSHSIKFQAEVANRSNDTNYWQTFNGNRSGGYNNPNVDSSGKTIVLKNGSTLEPVSSIDFSSSNAPAPLYSGFDYNNDGTPDRPSLGRFLYEKGFAVPQGSYDVTEFSTNPNYDPPNGYTIVNLDDKERILAIEIGKDDNGMNNDPNGDGERHPGFDLQDNVIIMRHEAFAEEH